MVLNILWNKRTIQILLALFQGPKGIQDVQEAVGGSYHNIYAGLRQLSDSGLVTDESLADAKYFKAPGNKRWFQITSEGENLVRRLLSTGLLRIPTLKKDRQKWIILILNSMNKVVGRTRFMKLLFLFRREPGWWKGSYFKFKADNFGPSSKDVLADIQELGKNGLVEEEETQIGKDEFSEEEKIRYTYTLTSKGNALAVELLPECPPGAKRKMEKMQAFNRMPLLELLRYVYERYPQFISNSTIVDKVLGNHKDEW